MENRFARPAEVTVLGVEDDTVDELEPLSLSELFPKDSRDLDRMFPEPEIRQLFQDIVGDLQEVERFRLRTDKQLEQELKADGKGARAVGPAAWKNILGR